MASNVRGASPAERSERWVGAAALVGNGEQRTRGFARRTQRAMGRRGGARRKWRATYAGLRPQNAASDGEARLRSSEMASNVRGASPAERSERWVGAAALVGNGEQRTR